MSFRNAGTAFDHAANAYEDARPGYPAELIGELIRQAHLGSESRILEIGPGTGQLTLPLAMHNSAITAIELGANLAQIAARRLSPYPKVKVICGAFEAWNAAGRVFDLVVSAQALHWIDPFIGFLKIHQRLKSSGTLAVVYNLYRGCSDDVHQAIDSAYHQHLPGPSDQGANTRLADRVEQTIELIRSSECFSEPSMWQHAWTERYTTERYLKLLRTFSDHRTLEPRTRRRLHRAVRHAIDAHGGQIERPLMATLFLSRPV